MVGADCRILGWDGVFYIFTGTVLPVLTKCLNPLMLKHCDFLGASPVAMLPHCFTCGVFVQMLSFYCTHPLHPTVGF